MLCCMARDFVTRLDAYLGNGLQLMQSHGMDGHVLPVSCRLGEQPVLVLKPTIRKGEVNSLTHCLSGCLQIKHGL